MKYLDESVCRELNLFNYSYKRRSGTYSIDDISDKEGWKSVRNSLIKNIGKHEHDGRDLDLQYANRVYDYIRFLWGDDVVFTTIIEGDLWEF
jgi:stage V sporulation protein R